ncbi:translation initiation factor IF-2-like [Vidua chalybeata]|uniref:translation initiation factor IF-2-like n=1 Tax=Vidua chalybeata TaxID=81927 RepID=UPI0023A7ED23|nr:translation initiation factor IF-2-like [Vidua chalybeata]
MDIQYHRTTYTIIVCLELERAFCLKARKTKTKVFPARCVGVRQQNRSQDQHEPPPVTTPGPTQGTTPPAPWGSPSVSPRTAAARSHTGGGDTHSPAGWGQRGVSPEPPSLPPGSGAALPALKSTPHNSPSPPPSLTVLRWGLGSGCGCGSGGCIPAPRLCPGPRCGGPPAPPEEGERKRRVPRRARARGAEAGAGTGVPGQSAAGKRFRAQCGALGPPGGAGPRLRPTASDMARPARAGPHGSRETWRRGGGAGARRRAATSGRDRGGPGGGAGGRGQGGVRGLCSTPVPPAARYRGRTQRL